MVCATARTRRRSWRVRTRIIPVGDEIAQQRHHLALYHRVEARCPLVRDELEASQEWRQVPSYASCGQDETKVGELAPQRLSAIEHGGRGLIPPFQDRSHIASGTRHR